MTAYDLKYGYERILGFLPPVCKRKITELQTKHSLKESQINEIRLRCMRQVSITAGNKSYICDYTMSEEDMNITLRHLCAGSVYAYQKTIKQGYIPISFGGRAGVVGDITDESFDIAIESITSINIRIPHHIRGICGKIYDIFIKHGRGLIIYAPPGVGKTTFLRDLSIELSRGDKAKKVALIDSRRELDNGFIPADCLIDTLSGYPKAMGIEIAIRTMSCEVVVCDEIGGEEIDSIRKSMFWGVPVIAAAHASSISELKKRDGISALIRDGAFSHAVGLSRAGAKTDFDFEITVLGDG